MASSPLPHWPKKLRSKLSSRCLRPISSDDLHLDGASSSSSCFASALTNDSAPFSSNWKKRARGSNGSPPDRAGAAESRFRSEANSAFASDCAAAVESCFQSEANSAIVSDCASNLAVSGISRVSGDLRTTARSPEVDQSPDRDDLACSEELSGRSEYSTCNEMTLSEFESELFGDSSEEYYSDVSRSYLTESSDNFSERSRDDPSTSVAFSLFRQFSDQLMALPPPVAPTPMDLEYDDDFILMRFEEEDEDSYMTFRTWERRVVIPGCSAFAGDYDALVLRERLLMVNWIVEHSNAMQLKNETLFLGVSLMDRFLSRGYFRTKKNLHLLGIACVTLATRLEENQPYNNVRRRMFLVGENSYSRSEVVAMEWLVQEVLNFQCLHPTIYNFLWFYLKAARADAKVEGLAKYLAVTCLVDHNRLRFWPSSVAAGLVVLASLAKDCDDSCQLVMETHVRTRDDDLPECIKSLEWLVRHAAC